MHSKRVLVRVLIPLIALLALLVGPMAVQAAPPVQPSTEPVEVGPSTTVTARLGLNLRTGPSLENSLVLVLYKGETVYTLGDTQWNQGILWTKVRVYRGGYYYDGYCAGAHLANYSGYTASGESGLKVTASEGLRLRSGPGLGYSIQRIVPYGAILRDAGGRDTGSGLDWTQVYINGTALWAASDYLEGV